MDADKTCGEKAREELRKQAMSYTEQIPKQHPMRQQLYIHLLTSNKTNKACGTLLDEIISNVLLMDPFT